MRVHIVLKLLVVFFRVSLALVEFQIQLIGEAHANWKISTTTDVTPTGVSTTLMAQNGDFNYEFHFEGDRVNAVSDSILPAVVQKLEKTVLLNGPGAGTTLESHVKLLLFAGIPQENFQSCLTFFDLAMDHTKNKESEAIYALLALPDKPCGNNIDLVVTKVRYDPQMPISRPVIPQTVTHTKMLLELASTMLVEMNNRLGLIEEAQTPPEIAHVKPEPSPRPAASQEPTSTRNTGKRKRIAVVKPPEPIFYTTTPIGDKSSAKKKFLSIEPPASSYSKRADGRGGPPRASQPHH